MKPASYMRDRAMQINFADPFPRMADIVPKIEKVSTGDAVVSLTTFEIPKEPTVGMLMAAQDGDPYWHTREGSYAKLIVNGMIMMTDTDMERMTNVPFYNNARGRVLIAGLGIGMIVHAALLKDAVTEVVVIEKYPALIKAIRPTLPKVKGKKLMLVCADIDTWEPTAGEKFDTLYFDIWPDRSIRNLPHIDRLHARFRKYRAKGGWMDSWYHRELKAMKKSGEYDD